MKTFNRVILASLLVVASFTTAASFSQETAATPTPSTTAFELRIYTAAEGKLDALNARFRNHTLKIFEKHGIKNIGYWTGTEGEDKNKIFYIIAYPDLASREKMLINGIAKDPEFLKIVAESEKDGKLTTKVESIMLKSTDYSPIQ
ncbi:NIPSNAP family protein [Lacunimicrobium album]